MNKRSRPIYSREGSNRVHKSRRLIRSQLQLKEELSSKSNIVVISGAGISTNAGISDFYSSSRTNSSRNIFDASAYLIPERAAKLHNQVLTIFESASKSGLKPHDYLMEAWAQSGRLLRHYTQNVDCRSDRLPFLSQKTVMLHGRVDTLRCTIRPRHTLRVTTESFLQKVDAQCPVCEEEQAKRVLNGLRRRSIGKLRTSVLLYNEPNPDDSEAMAAFNDDLSRPVDAVVVVGTRLQIGDLRAFVDDLCQGAGGTDCMTVWVNRNHQEPGITIGHHYIGDCDDFASLLLE
ncbi:DHS-like NAD/FAD-binding domain-containing protein [Dendryphion nanum]|uniref:DHS-like NAD/FAD-binding domain-containing protein n=1 Tax=Dendryphion nanum TaxID=256645 RepID=A0A9P9D0F9_9PLEO|nr:DHS-like NAD/FAD-binding domain-containing protein [Dendryphion nanum]